MQPNARRLTYELSTLCRYINRNLPLSGDSVDELAPRFADLKSLLHKIESNLDSIERKSL